jgi:hypothetical protein
MAAMRRLVTVTFLLALGTACGGRTLGGGTGGNGDGGGNMNGHDAGGTFTGDDGDFPLCPSDLPITGSSCDSPGLVCSYYAGQNCEGAACEADGTWQPSPCH